MAVSRSNVDAVKSDLRAESYIVDSVSTASLKEDLSNSYQDPEILALIAVRYLTQLEKTKELRDIFFKALEALVFKSDALGNYFIVLLSKTDEEINAEVDAASENSSEKKQKEANRFLRMLLVTHSEELQKAAPTLFLIKVTTQPMSVGTITFLNALHEAKQPVIVADDAKVRLTSFQKKLKEANESLLPTIEKTFVVFSSKEQIAMRDKIANKAITLPELLVIVTNAKLRAAFKAEMNRKSGFLGLFGDVALTNNDLLSCLKLSENSPISVNNISELLDNDEGRRTAAISKIERELSPRQQEVPNVNVLVRNASVSSHLSDTLGAGVQLTRTPDRQILRSQEREDNVEEENIQVPVERNLFGDDPVDGVSDARNLDNRVEVSQVIEGMLGELSRNNSVSQDLSEVSGAGVQLPLQIEPALVVRDSVDLDSNSDESEGDNVSVTGYDVTTTVLSRIQAKVEEDVSDRPESESGGSNSYESQEEDVSVKEYCVNDAVSKKLQAFRAVSEINSDVSEEDNVSVTSYDVNVAVAVKNSQCEEGVNSASVAIEEQERERLTYLRVSAFLKNGYEWPKKTPVPTVVETDDDQNSDDASLTSRSTCSL